MRLILISLVAALMCGGVSAGPMGTFRHAHNVGFGAHSSLDPADKGRVLLIIEKLQSRLVRPGSTGRPEADLATDWHSNDTGTLWTFTLREGVTFHDGSAFDASDVVYSMQRILNPDNASPARTAIEMVTEVRANGPHEVQFILADSFADLPLQLMDPRLRIIPEGSSDTIGQTGLGTGPFMLEKFDADGITRLVAFEDYFEGPPGLARIEVIGIPDAQARLQAFLAGQLDMERGILPLLRRAMSKTDRYVLQEIPTGNWSGFVFRTDVAPYDDVRVRRALRMVADREELLKLALDGGGIIACDTPVAPNDQYRSNSPCPPDPEGARALLAQAGFADGIEVDLHVSSIDQSWASMAAAYQEQAAAAGIHVNIINASADGYWSEVWRHKDAFATSWGERPADQVLNEAFHSAAKWNESYIKAPAFDHLLAKARVTLDFDARRALYIAAQDYLAENSGTLIPFHVTQMVGLSPRVKGLEPVRTDAVRWHLVTVDDGGS